MKGDIKYQVYIKLCLTVMESTPQVYNALKLTLMAS